MKALLYSFAFLEISETPTVDEILPLLEAELNHWVDLSAYAHRELPKENPSKSSNIYDFLYYNSVEGYMTNWMRVSVGKDGRVFGLAVYNLDCEVDALPLSCIDKETETELQKLKLQDIYASSISPSAFESYETHYFPEIVLFDDQPYVLYYVSATYAYHGSSMHTFMHEILVPLELLMPANT